jgi:formylglycine-generating enzyme
MTRPLMLAALFAAAVVGGCGGQTGDARDQWRVVISTDAAVPQFGDRVLVEVLDEQGEPACPGCRRQLGVPDRWPLSFGIVPPESGRAVRVRARLYRAAYAGNDGLPRGELVIEALGRLPSVRGVTDVHLRLSMNCFGIAADPTARTSCEADTGELVPEPELAGSSAPPLQAGSWPPGVAKACAGDVPSGMVCVEGGAFLLGSPFFLFIGAAGAPTPEKLVVLSPYALDTEEVTVGAIRSLVQNGKVEPPVERGQALDSEYCTYLGTDDETNDAMPVNCIRQEHAARVCEALGKRLPTEAEWEFAAGNTTLETTYPWGSDDDLCKHTIIGRGRLGSDFVSEYDFCLEDVDAPTGPAAGGHARDVTALGIKNLSGNLDEWVADRFSSYAAPCWTRPQPLVDPRCDEFVEDPESPLAEQSLRGASWEETGLKARAFMREATVLTSRVIFTGFRCAKSM